MSPIISKQPQNKKSSVKSDSFAESIRGIGSNVGDSLKNDLFKPGAKDIFDSFSPFGFPSPNENQKSNEGPYPRDFGQESLLRNKLRQSETVKREERVIFTRKERETQTQVKSLQEEIVKLAKATGEIAKETQIAAMNVQSTPGTYHINFFERLILIVRNLRGQIQDSSFWLASWNKKSQKKNIYWKNFKKSGSSFLLHHDRNVATQAG